MGARLRARISKSDESAQGSLGQVTVASNRLDSLDHQQSPKAGRFQRRVSIRTRAAGGKAAAEKLKANPTKKHLAVSVSTNPTIDARARAALFSPTAALDPEPAVAPKATDLSTQLPEKKKKKKDEEDEEDEEEERTKLERLHRQ
ncbi:MAG: hypothetical protein LQ339_004394 [Xanthoria mediterranea]|nr:MAG: hypothetical protein LQ339_004394 [Xanthoria mediterranea]